MLTTSRAHAEAGKPPVLHALTAPTLPFQVPATSVAFASCCFYLGAEHVLQLEDVAVNPQGPQLRCCRHDQQQLEA